MGCKLLQERADAVCIAARHQQGMQAGVKELWHVVWQWVCRLQILELLPQLNFNFSFLQNPFLCQLVLCMKTARSGLHVKTHARQAQGVQLGMYSKQVQALASPNHLIWTWRLARVL